MPTIDESTITDVASARWREKAHDARLGEVMGSLIEHLHAFARDVQLTEAEWYAATEFLSAVGQASNAKRKEFILLSDTVGLSFLVTLMNNRRSGIATEPTLLGPFYIPDSIVIPYGGRLPAVSDDDGVPLFVQGTVRSAEGGPIAGAAIDVWQTDHEGVYEAQLAVDEHRHRAIMLSEADGSFMFRTVVPADYAIPTDGPVGALIARTAISEYRPSHIHFKVSADGFMPLTTHLFDSASPFIDDDVVFGVRESLVTDFVRHDPGAAPNGDIVDRAYRILTHDFILPQVG